MFFYTDSCVLFSATLHQVVEKFHNSPSGDSDITLLGMVDEGEIKAKPLKGCSWN